MPTWFPAVRFRGLAVAVLFAWIASGGIAIAGEERPPSAGGTKIDVELKIIPFFAVDAEGRPVFDLRREEVELRVDGAPVAIQGFDRYATSDAANEPPREGIAPAAPVAGRHVFLLFDVAFSSPHGLLASAEVAREYVGQLRAADRLYLLLHDRRSGLKQVLGPVAADEKGKEKVLKRIRDLRPDVQGLETRADLALPPSITGTGGKKGIPADQDSATRDA